VSLEPAAYVSSVQQGTITLAAGVGTNTATISAVDTSKSVALLRGVSTDVGLVSSANYQCVHARITLTNSTTVTATRSNTTGELVVSFAVIQFR